MRPPSSVSRPWEPSGAGSTGRLVLMGLLLSLVLAVVGTVLGGHGVQAGAPDQLTVSLAAQPADASVIPGPVHAADCLHGGAAHPPEAGDCIMAVSPTPPLCSEPAPDAQPIDADSTPVRARAEVDRRTTPPLSLHALSISRV